jgi:hypothetical protein
MTDTKFTFNVLVEEQGGVHLAHCLEMGLVAAGDDCDEVVTTMGKLIYRQLQFALENDNPSDIYHAAPDEVWQKFRQAVASADEPATKMAKPFHFGNWQAMNEVSYVACC